MAVATILHLSDLHFGCQGQDQVWGSLREYINKDMDVDLVLVTGDIVDSPSDEVFAEAKRELGSLKTKHHRQYLVCSGNHDKHWRGNATGALTRLLPKFRHAQDAGRRFAEFFAGHLTQVDQYEDLDLKAGSYRWRIRIGALETASDAKHLARGYVDPMHLQGVRSLARDVRDVDAVLLLMHHHLLPIAGVERTSQPAKELLASTTVVNAGMTLGAIVGSQVNLVLHGHEHQRNIARYGIFGPGHGETVVLGCGSSTGTVTLAHNDLNRASSNVIELHDDQSIWVKELRNENGRWHVHEETETCIVQTADLRRSKFFRVAGAEKLQPTSEVVKHVRFTPQRNILVHEHRSDWLIKGSEFAIKTRNRTGVPINPQVKLALPPNTSARSVSRNGFEVTNEQGYYLYRLALSQPGPTLAGSVDIAFEWIDGAILCIEDLELVAPENRGLFRDQGREFVALSVTNELRSLQLHAHLPTGFWPELEDLKVFVQDMKSNDPPQERPYLREHLRTSGPGVLSLAIPYPMAGYRYFMTWRLPSGPKATPKCVALREVLREDPLAMLGAFQKGIASAKWSSYVSLGLYLPEATAGTVTVAHLLAHEAQAKALALKPPEAVSLRGRQIAYKHAWWDDDGITYSQGAALPDADALDAGALPRERWLFVLPVRELGAAAGAIPVALLRVGVSDGVDQLGLGSPDAVDEFSDVWPQGLISLLHEASSRL